MNFRRPVGDAILKSLFANIEQKMVDGEIQLPFASLVLSAEKGVGHSPR